MRDTIAVTFSTQAAHRVAQLRSLKIQVLGRDRSIPHVGRKVYHMAAGLSCMGLYALVLDRTGALVTLGALGGLFVLCDGLRLKFPAINAAALQVFGNLMRREELKSLSANSFYIVGMFLCVLVFPKPIAILSILFLAVGDPVAAIVGTLYGRHKIVAGKSLEGSMANFCASAAGSLALALFYFQLSPEKGLQLGIIGGATSAIAELCPLPFNDNLTIPLLSAVLLSVLMTVIPIF